MGQPSERAGITAAIDELERLTSVVEQAGRAVADAHRLERLANRTVADLDRESARAVTEFAKAQVRSSHLGRPRSTIPTCQPRGRA